MTRDTYCRLCAMKIESYIKIYDEEGEKLNLATKIIQCLQIWLYPEDVLPKTICVECCSKVELFFEFFQICSQSQISLMSMFKDKGEEEKVIISGVQEIHHESEMQLDYGDDGHSEAVSEEIRDECVEYTNLGVAEKTSSKRKLRTPIKRSLSEDNIEIKIDDSEENHMSERPARKCKSKSRLELSGDEEEKEEILSGEEEEGGDEQIVSGRGAFGIKLKLSKKQQQKPLTKHEKRLRHNLLARERQRKYREQMSEDKKEEKKRKDRERYWEKVKKKCEIDISVENMEAQRKLWREKAQSYRRRNKEQMETLRLNNLQTDHGLLIKERKLHLARERCRRYRKQMSAEKLEEKRRRDRERYREKIKKKPMSGIKISEDKQAKRKYRREQAQLYRERKRKKLEHLASSLLWFKEGPVSAAALANI